MKDTKTELFNAARELFCEHGYKDTNVSMVTRKAGIGVGTFYNFYSSKEQLFLEVFQAENLLLKRQAVGSVDLDGDPVDVFKAIIGRILAGLKENPILRESYDRNVQAKILDMMSREDFNNYYAQASYDLFAGVIQKFRLNGTFRQDIEPDMILALFDSLVYVDLHKQDIGTHLFPDLIDLFIELVVEGLRAR